MVVVVIPIYKSILTEYERVSLRRGLEAFRNIPICFVAPKGLTLQDYQDDYRYEYFEQSYFYSTMTYNKLLLSPIFYERFLQYEYILIYQLDAFVLNNKLCDFIRSDYDYIGAPWLSGIKVYNSNFRACRYIDKILPFLNISNTVYVGNGGVSLRRVKKHIEILEKMRSMAVSWKENEDIFWGYMGYLYSSEFRVAPLEVALKFAFEKNPRLCYKKNGNNLPFACHAWEKWDIDFWRHHFERLGYYI